MVIENSARQGDRLSEPREAKGWGSRAKSRVSYDVRVD